MESHNAMLMERPAEGTHLVSTIQVKPGRAGINLPIERGWVGKNLPRGQRADGQGVGSD